MIRPLTLVTMVAAMGAGLHVYQTKHAVAQLDKDLRGIARQIEDQNERSLALSAEWAWLNEPERLRQAANRHLALEPMTPTQFVRFAEFERRLPQVAAWDGPPALFAARDQRGAVQEPNGATRLELAERPAPTPAQRVTIAAATPTQPVDAAAPAVPAVARADEPATVAPPVRTAATPAATMPRPAEAPAARAPEPARPAAAEPPRSEPAPPPALAALSGVAVAAAAAAAPVRTETPPTPRPAPVARPRPAPRPAPDLASLPPIAGPTRVAEPVTHGPTRAAEVPRVPAMVRTPAPAPAFATAAPPAQPAGSMLGGGGTRTALAPPVPYGSLPPPVPFASASAAR